SPVDELSCFAGHPEFAAPKMRRNVFRGLPGQSDFHIMNNSSTVHGDPRKKAPLDCMDDYGIEPYFYGMCPHSQNDRFFFSDCLRYGIGCLSEIFGGQYGGQRIHKLPK